MTRTGGASSIGIDNGKSNTTSGTRHNNHNHENDNDDGNNNSNNNDNEHSHRDNQSVMLRNARRRVLNPISLRHAFVRAPLFMR